MSIPTITKFYDEAQALKDARSYHPDMQVDFMRQSGLYAYYSSLYAKAEAQYERLCHALERAEAQLDKHVRKARVDAGEKKPTNDEIKAEIIADPRIHGAKLLIVEAREQMTLLRGMCEALKQRCNMLVQLGAVSREELKGGPTVMATANKENRNERLKLASDTHFNLEND